MSDLHSQADLYAVGALESDEAAEFEAHLARCPECRSDVARAREAMAHVSELAASDPPASLRSSVLAAITTTPQDAAAEQAGGPDRTHVVPLRRPATTRRLPTLLAAAAVVVALAMGGWAWQSRQAAEDATATAERLTALLGAPDVQTVSGGATTGGTGTVVMSQQRGQAMFVSSDLPDLPEGKVYELWTIEADPVPAGTFDADDATVVLPEATLDAASVAVTVEPEGGSDRPTTDPIFSVVLPDR